MAPPADDGGWARAVALARLLAPRPGRLEFAARLALICALTTLVAEIYQTPEVALTAYVVFFLNRPDRATSLVLGVAMTVVISLVIGLIFLLAKLVVDEPAWRVATMAAVSFGLLFLVSASKLRPLGSTIALVVAYGLDLLGSIPTGELATRGLLYGWLFVGIPAGVSLVVNLLLAPSPRDLVQRALAERLRLAAAALRGDVAASDGLTACVREGDGEIQSRLKLAGAERTSPPQDIAALRQAADATISLLSAIDFVVRTPEASLPQPVRASLSATLDRMATILHGGRYPVDVVPDVAADADLAPLPAAALSAVRDAMVHFAVPPVAVAADAAPPGQARSGFLLPDALTNPDHTRYALKTTAAAMFCYLLYSLLDWPGIHTSLITCYIVSLSTLAESVEKLCLRIAGCLLGAALGLAVMIFVIPAVTSIAGLLSIVFLGALVAAWVAAGSARIAYAGFQIAFAFFLCVAQGAGPSFDMVVARDRVIGILLGNVVVYALSTHLWPVSVGGRIESGIVSVARRLSQMAQATDRRARRRLAAEAQAALGATETDLGLARYEPASVRPSGHWLSVRREVAARAGALEASLLLLAEQGNAPPAALVRRLDRLAGGPQGGGPSAVEPASASSDAPDDAAPLRAFVDRQLRSLEAVWPAMDHREGTPHAPT